VSAKINEIGLRKDSNFEEGSSGEASLLEKQKEG
jgi:hypothetical protein